MNREHRGPSKRLSKSRSLNRTFTVVLLGVSLPLVALALVIARPLPPAADRTIHGPRPAERVDALDGELRIPLTKARDGQAAFFRLADDGAESLRFFVVADANGGYQVALDDCGECRVKRGYRQENQAMVCNYCNKSFAIESLNHRSTRCAPVPVPAAVESGQIVVRTSDLRVSL